MDKIKEQASKVSQIVFATDTASTYQRTLLLTWDIIRETGLLLWLVVMLTFVGAEWFYYTSVKLGRRGRSWYNTLGDGASSGEPMSFSATGEAALETVKSGAAYVLEKAREQLGVSAPEPPPPVVKPAPTAPAPSAAPTAPDPDPTPVPPAAPPTAATLTEEEESDTDFDL